MIFEDKDFLEKLKKHVEIDSRLAQAVEVGSNQTKNMFYVTCTIGAGLIAVFLVSFMCYGTLKYNQGLMEKMQPRQLEEYIDARLEGLRCNEENKSNP